MMSFFGGKPPTFTVPVGESVIAVDARDTTATLSPAVLAVILETIRQTLNAAMRNHLTRHGIRPCDAPNKGLEGDALFRALSRKSMIFGYRRRLVFTQNSWLTPCLLDGGCSPPRGDITILIGETLSDEEFATCVQRVVREFWHVYVEVCSGVISETSDSLPKSGPPVGWCRSSEGVLWDVLSAVLAAVEQFRATGENAAFLRTPPRSTQRR